MLHRLVLLWLPVTSSIPSLTDTDNISSAISKIPIISPHCSDDDLSHQLPSAVAIKPLTVTAYQLQSQCHKGTVTNSYTISFGVSTQVYLSMMLLTLAMMK